MKDRDGDGYNSYIWHELMNKLWEKTVSKEVVSNLNKGGTWHEKYFKFE